jgi:putative transposase
MPDHVHLLYKSTTEEDLRCTLQALKGSAAHRLAASSGRRAPIWQAETFDHLIRNESEAEETWAYIEMNPVRKGLCLKPGHYRWSSAHKRTDTET